MAGCSQRAFRRFCACAPLCFSFSLRADRRGIDLHGAAGPAIVFHVVRVYDGHLLVHGGGDAATTGHLYRRQGHRRGSPSAVRKCARIDQLSRRYDMIAWPCSALRVRHPRDLCLVGIGEHPQYLPRQLECLYITFAVRLIENLRTITGLPYIPYIEKHFSTRTIYGKGIQSLRYVVRINSGGGPNCGCGGDGILEVRVRVIVERPIDEPPQVFINAYCNEYLVNPFINSKRMKVIPL